VRKFWSRVLATQSIAEKKAITKPSLSLLQNIDGELSRALTDYVAFLLIFGCYPHERDIDPQAASPRDLVMLSEIGFIAAGMDNPLAFREFKLRLGGRNQRLDHIHGKYQLTQRGYELCVAIFEVEDPFSDHLKDKRLTDEQIINTYSQFIDKAI